MNKVHVLVEGQTEETFVRDILRPHLELHGLYVIAKIVTTKRTKVGPDFKGGVTNYQKVKNDLLRLLGDTSAIAVSTMIDYYGLPHDFPGKNSLTSGTCFDRVSYLEKAFERDIDNQRFIPYLSLHEYEAMLFVSPGEMGKVFPDAEIENDLSAIASSFETPEEINEGSETHPSARICKFVAGYQKRLHGPMVAARIGLTQIRGRCSHFDSWLRKLENLAT
jgi:hypothetical protein